MDQFRGDFQNFDMQQLMKLAQSSAAQQLFAMLRNSNDPMFQAALEQAAAGNPEPAKQLLSRMMENDDTKRLIQQITEDSNG